MTSRERLLTTLSGGIPDCVPVMPDFSNMIPCKLTGKPFWDIYLYNDPPHWKAYLNAAKHFNVDSLMDGYFPLSFPEDTPQDGPQWEQFIVYKDPGRIVTQSSYEEKGERHWAERVTVYYVADPPTWGVPPGKIGLPLVPERWEPVEGVKPLDTSPEGFAKAKAELGDQGLMGVYVCSTCGLGNTEDIYNYYDHPDKHEEWARQRVEWMEHRYAQVMSMETKPDFLAVGGSGTLVFQTVDIFRQLAFPAVKKCVEMATRDGLMTHIHSCGPEKELVKIMAEETSLSVIDPLEMPPMGDCDLAELKRLYGDKITLKGNLHTTETMLKGTVEDVIEASKKAIDAAAAGGRFVLSTGDQCGRDTPFENIEAMIETARTYGKY